MNARTLAGARGGNTLLDVTSTNHALRRHLVIVSHVLIAVAWLATTAPAADIEKIDRTIAKEPAYQTKSPEYCLLVFGPEAKTRVWLVLDGDALYVDRNGNGDLTEQGERVERVQAGEISRARFVSKDGRERIAREPVAFRGKAFLLGDIVERDGKTRHSDFLVYQFVDRDADSEKDVCYFQVECMINGTFIQSRIKPAADRSADAPVIHFNGPLTFLLAWPADQVLTRGDESSELFVVIATPHQGKAVFGAEVLSLGGLPAALHPLAEIEFPSKAVGGKPLKTKVVFDQRCCGTVFHGPVRVPKEAGKGNARITMSFPDWQEGNVASTTFEVPIVDKPPSNKK